MMEWVSGGVRHPAGESVWAVAVLWPWEWAAEVGWGWVAGQGCEHSVDQSSHGYSSYFGQWQEGRRYRVRKIWVWTASVPVLALKVPCPETP